MAEGFEILERKYIKAIITEDFAKKAFKVAL